MTTPFRQFIAFIVLLSSWVGVQAQTNLLRGIKAEYETKPCYDLCNSESDPWDLTDGVAKVGPGWFYKSTVGWKGTHCGALFDLGKVVNGGKFRIHATWGAWVTQPERIYVLVSLDNVHYALVDEIIRHQNYPPFSQEVGISFWMDSREFNRQFRYLRFIAIPSRPIGHFNCDEVELLEGTPDAVPVDKDAEYPAGELAFVNFQNAIGRIRRDCNIIRDNARQLDVPENVDLIEGDIKSDINGNTALLGTDNAFPLDRTHLLLAEENQRVLSAAKYSDVIFSWVQRYQPNNSFTLPTPFNQAEALYLYPGERRYFAFNLTNPLPEKETVEVAVQSVFPVKLYKAVASVTPDQFFNTNRLEDLDCSSGSIAVDIIPGETVQIFGAVTAEGGVQESEVLFTVKGKTYTLPVHVGTAWAMPERFTAKFCQWDFLSCLDAEFAQGKGNLARLLELMEEHKLDWTWLSDAMLPVPEPDKWNNEVYIGELDFSNIDAWVELMGGRAEYFCIYLGAHRFGENNFGVKPEENQELFKARLYFYFCKLADYVKNHCQLEPSKVLIHSLDEAWTDSEKIVLAACCEAIKKSNSGFLIFSDPGIKKDDEYFLDVDVLSPCTPFTEKMLSDYLASDARRAQDGLYFGFYRCDSRTRELDPYMYYGNSFRAGFLFSKFFGAGFWQLSDCARTLDEISAGRSARCPLYFAGNQVWTSKQYEAIYEGREDYEYMLHLRQLNQQLAANDSPLAAEGAALEQAIMKQLADEMSNGERILYWNANHDRGAFDRLREKMWHFFEKAF